MIVSGKTAYGNLVGKHYKMLENADKCTLGSEPIVITKAILKSVKSPNPNQGTIGGGAKFLRRILSDKLFDRIMLGQMKNL